MESTRDEEEQKYLDTIDFFIERIDNKTATSEEIMQIRKFLEESKDVFCRNNSTINQFLKILKKLNENMQNFQTYKQLDNYSVILNRLKSEEKFWNNIPKKAKKKIEKTIEEIKPRLTEIYRRDVMQAKVMLEQRKKNSKVNRAQNRRKRQRTQILDSMRKQSGKSHDSVKRSFEQVDAPNLKMQRVSEHKSFKVEGDNSQNHND